MPDTTLPFEPIPRQLYSRAALYEGFIPEEPGTFARTADFTIYRHYVMQGRGSPVNPYVGMMQALHDNAIHQSVGATIAGRKTAAVMGDHKLARDSGSYRRIVELARRLTRGGILVCTGGGPGAMEAGHLGASLANADDSELEDALARLAIAPVVPALMNIVAADGRVDPQRTAEAHAWLRPALELAASIRNPGQSLAFPTWHYGHEPTTPLATHIAKYFQNSIREDGLLAVARQGIVFFEGKAGTIQEIFQDGAQNFYRSFGCFSPMVLFGVDYWSDQLPVLPLMRKLFASTDFEKFILATDDIDAAARFIEEFDPQEAVR